MTLDESYKQRSLFYHLHARVDQNLSEAMSFWESVSIEKYTDIVGYFLVSFEKVIDGKVFAESEFQAVKSLLKTGELNLLTGYDDFDLEQIKPCYQCLNRYQWDNFISISEYQAYREAESKWQIGYDSMRAEGVVDERADNLPEMHLHYYFSRKWIVATQVQALIWYRNFLDNVKQNPNLLEKSDPNIDFGELALPPEKNKDKRKPETILWRNKAREIGEEWLRQQLALGKSPGVNAISQYIEGELSNLDIKDANGRFPTAENIKRETLKGITGKKLKGR